MYTVHPTAFYTRVINTMSVPIQTNTVLTAATVAPFWFDLYVLASEYFPSTVRLISSEKLDTLTLRFYPFFFFLQEVTGRKDLFLLGGVDGLIPLTSPRRKSLIPKGSAASFRKLSPFVHPMR